MPGVGVLAVAHYAPVRVLSNRELESRLDTSDEWIASRTGIKERRIAADEESTSTLAIEAASRLLEQTSTPRDEIDLVLVATMTPDSVLPAVAARVQHALGLKNAGGFDISIACSGFAYALTVALSFVETGFAQKVLVIGADVMSRVMDWSDRGTCVLFGDGAGAALVGRVADGYGLLAQELGSDGTGGDHLTIPAGAGRAPVEPNDTHHTLQMNGREVFRFAVSAMGGSALRVAQKAGLSPDQIDLFIPHQANIRIIESAAKKLGIGMDRVFVNLDRYGNTSCASIPIALSEATAAGRLRDGQTAVIVGFGGGLAWGSLVLRWGGSGGKSAKAASL